MAMFDDFRLWCRCPTDTQLLSHRQTPLSDRRVWSTLRRRARLLGSGCEPGGTVLLDDVHYSPQHAGDASDPRPSGPGHRQAHRGGHHEALRFRGNVQERRAQLLAEHQTKDLGAVWRTQLVACREGQLTRAVTSLMIDFYSRMQWLKWKIRGGRLPTMVVCLSLALYSLRWGNALSHKLEVGGTAFPCVPLHFNHCTAVWRRTLNSTGSRSTKTALN